MEVVLGKRAPQPGLFQRRRRDGSRLPGWWFRHFKADGKRTMVFAGSSLKEAKTFARARLTEVEEVKALPPEKRIEHPILAEFLVEYFPILEMRIAPTTLLTHKQNLLNAAMFLGEKTVDQVRRSDIEMWLANMKATRQVKTLTLRRHLSTLSVCFEDLIGRGHMDVNPCRGIRLPKAQEFPVPYLEPDDLRRIYAACAPWLRPFIVLLGETGLRLGELHSTTWQDVDRGFDRISVRHSKSRKTRIVPLTPLAQEALREMETRRGPTPLIGLQPIFGEGFNDSWVRKNYHAAVRKAGFESLRLHDLRHAFASSLVRAGVPIPAVADLMGHSTAELVLTRYGKHAPSNAGDQAILALAKFRGELPEETPQAERKVPQDQ
jgi:integrase